MDWLTPVSDDAMSDAQAKVFERAKGKFDLDPEQEVPTWLRVMVNSPDFLKDAYMNVSQHLLKDGALKSSVKMILATVAASHAGNKELSEFFAARAVAAGITREQLYEAVGIGATSTSFNLYYKFRSLAHTRDFDGFKPGMRATLFQRPGMGKAFAELVNLMISTANGCSSCVSGHIQEAEQHDVSKDQIDEAIRVGAVVQSMCMFLATSDYGG
jgi:alkyl hydroperoxide reductase subunit D